ncbi:hypothetical protein KC19_5G075300 [Ceratodon purpureus]|uniref:Uncharacterized protein n=1 Tax=Ceratodon purpureus TaxID=3225 RepID=A0A8T0I1B1_CERPU|nr:hypothetical protein KC19_5G075300 [Ceratodon purpureus]
MFAALSSSLDSCWKSSYKRPSLSLISSKPTQVTRLFVDPQGHCSPHFDLRIGNDSKGTDLDIINVLCKQGRVIQYSHS